MSGLGGDVRNLPALRYPEGARVVVRFGGFGTQVAEVLGLMSGGRYKVLKYRAKSKRWTQSVVWDTDILRHAAGAELRPWSPAARELSRRLEVRRAERKARGALVDAMRAAPAAPNLGAAFVLANGGKLPKGAA
jgi:hypothetical protein